MEYVYYMPDFNEIRIFKHLGLDEIVFLRWINNEVVEFAAELHFIGEL